MSFDLSNYEMVDVRLKRFMEDHKDSAISIITEIMPTPSCLKGLTFKATIEVKDIENGNVFLKSTGWANEIPGDGMVNKDSPLENTETSAVGRALANLAYSGSKRPSVEEMKKVGKNAYSETNTAPEPNTAPKTRKLEPRSDMVKLDEEIHEALTKYRPEFDKMTWRVAAGSDPGLFINWIDKLVDWQKKQPVSKYTQPKLEFYKLAREYAAGLMTPDEVPF